MYIKILLVSALLSASISIDTAAAQGIITETLTEVSGGKKTTTRITRKETVTKPYHLNKTTTLYNLNGEPKTCEDNMKNLFKAWDKDNISNADEFKLISYKSLCAVKDTVQAREYATKMTQIDYPTLNSNSYGSEGTGQRKSKVNVLVITYKQILDEMPQEKQADAKEKTAQLLSERRDRLNQNIKPGFEVYSILMDHKGQKFEFLVFCDPTTNNVTIDYNFKNIILGQKN